MARPNALAAEAGIQSGIILDSRDLFSRERYEQRLDMQLAILTQQFQKTKKVDNQQVRQVVGEFIKDIEIIFRELEDAKRKAEQEELGKIEKIRLLLIEGAKINSGKFKKELEKFGETIKSNTVSGLRQYRRRERRLKRGKAPLGFFLKKVRQDRALERDVARRTGAEVKDIQQEHQLISEVGYLIKALNSRIPDEKTYAQLEERIRLLVDSYEKDLEDFLNIEVDIEIEQARKFHRIEHYIAFLKMAGGFEDLINKLNDLKKRAEYWVYQDSIDAKKLVRYAKAIDYGLSALRASEASHDNDFPGVIAQNSPINGIVPGLLIYNKNNPKPNRAVVLLHAAYQSKESLLTLGKRLAMMDFWVYSIDLTSHGENTEKLHLGRTCEYVQTAAKWFRANGVSYVGVIGHSLGGVISLFALCGYNAEVESKFYSLVTRMAENLAYMGEIEKKGGGSNDSGKYISALSDDYTELKELVLYAIRTMYEGQGRIDAAVLLSAPLTIQFVFPPLASKILKILPISAHALIGKGINKLMNKSFIKNEGKDALLYRQMATKREAHVRSAVYSDAYYTYNYVQTVKNPYDFINLINFLCDNVEISKEAGFFKYYRNRVKATPKLFIYGLADKFLKPFKKNNMPDLEQHYKNMGQTKIVRYANVVHSLNKEGKDSQFESGKLPKMAYEIATFLNNYLPKGKLV